MRDGVDWFVRDRLPVAHVWRADRDHRPLLSLVVAAQCASELSVRLQVGKSRKVYAAPLFPYLEHPSREVAVVPYATDMVIGYDIAVRVEMSGGNVGQPFLVWLGWLREGEPPPTPDHEIGIGFYDGPEDT